METGREWLFVGLNGEGVKCRIGEEEWEAHCAKRPAIATALELVITALTAPEGGCLISSAPMNRTVNFGCI